MAKTVAKRLPPIPKTAWSQLGPIAVVFVDDLETASEAFGCWCPEIRTIKLSPKPCPLMQWATFKHECIHAWLWDAGVGLAADAEERVADALSSAIVAEMRG